MYRKITYLYTFIHFERQPGSICPNVLSGCLWMKDLGWVCFLVFLPAPQLFITFNYAYFLFFLPKLSCINSVINNKTST